MKKAGVLILVFLFMASCAPSQKELRKESAASRPPKVTVSVTKRGFGVPAPEREVRVVSGTPEKPAAATPPPKVRKGDAKERSNARKLEAALEKLSQGLKKRKKPPARGSRPIRIAPRRSGRTGAVPDVVLNFENADLYEVLQVFSEVLGITYVVDPRVRGKVTIHTNKKLTRAQLQAVFHKVLELNGVTALKKDGFYEIVPLGEAVRRGSILAKGVRELKGLGPEKRVIEVIRCRYVDVAEIAKLVKPFLTEGATLSQFPLLNLLVISDDPDNVDRIRSIVHALDINAFERVHFRLYQLENATVDDVADDFKAAFDSIKLTERFGKNLVFSFTPISRINSILVISSVPELFDRIEPLIRTLDSEASENEERVYVYRVQNAKAEDMVKILEEVYGEGSKKQSRKKTTTSRSKQRKSLKTQRVRRLPYRKTSAQETGGLTVGEVKFVLDDINNAILIRATPRDYRAILHTIQSLDIYPRQVLIEVLIAEITLDDTTSLGFEWSKLGAQGTGSEVGWNSGIGASTAQPKITSGLIYTVNYVDSFISTLKAFATENKVNVLSSPHIIASNNQEAKIDISREVPIVTSQTTTVSATTTATGGTTTRDQTIEYRDTGIILTVTPYINDQGLVKLEISQEVSNVDTTTVVEGVNSPVFFKRVATTTLTVQDGQSVLIGGLISREKSRNRSGVPVLSKIPVLGWLFGFTKETVRKTELMILLTPRVIEHVEEADLVTAEFRQKINALKASVERSLKK